MKRSLLFIVIALVSVTSAGIAAENRWVEVTKPMIACEAVTDNPSLPHHLLDSLMKWQAFEAPAEGCKALAVGDKLQLDDQQTEAQTKLFVKSWRPVCRHGCSPYMTPVYSPSKAQVGAYLRPTKPPKGW
jgi:hypothetical protein